MKDSSYKVGFLDALMWSVVNQGRLSGLDADATANLCMQATDMYSKSESTIKWVNRSSGPEDITALRPHSNSWGAIRRYANNPSGTIN